MSDFWKKRRPQMTDEEERALWARVRTMPREGAGGAARARSPWAALWARPAVRFGAPVLAVALVAIVWVAQQSPEAPRRESAVGSVATSELEKVTPPATGGDAGTLPEAAPAPTPIPDRDARMVKDTRVKVAVETKNSIPPSLAPRVEGGSRMRKVAPEEAKEASEVGAPPTAGLDRKDEAARPSTKASASEPLASVRGEAERESAGLQAMRVAPDPVALQASRERAIRRGDFASLVFDDVVRPESGGAFGIVLSLPFGRQTVLLQRNGKDGRWEVRDDASLLEGSRRAVGVFERRSALAVELTRAVEARDADAIERVRQAARGLRADHPDDPGTRELQGWCEAARSAIPSE